MCERAFKFWWALPLLVALLLALGCTPAEPTRFYAITPLSSEPVETESGLVIGVAPIALAAYLDRSGIVTRTSPNELGVSALHNWIEPLDTQARRILARNLTTLLGTDRVFILPEQRLLPFDYTVEIAIERFDIALAPENTAAALEGQPQTAILEARWSVFRGDGRELVETTPARIAVAVAEPRDYERRVAAMSEALGRLSRVIATSIASRRTAG